MKIRFGADEKKYITVAELPAVRKIIDDMKDYDKKSFEDYANLALSYVTDGNSAHKIYEVNAHICRNSRIWNYYGDNSERLDVWVEMSGINWMDHGRCFVMLGFCLSDLWNVNSMDEETINVLKTNSYLRVFKEQE